MAIIKCKMCGGDLTLMQDQTVAECEYCGSRQTVPAVDDERKLILFERAERLRRQCEFDKAAGVYETIVADFRQEPEAYWGLVLCRFGIEYVDDPATGKKVPTCHRSSFDSVLEDPDFDQAVENADPMARRVYREEAKQIEELRRSIIAVSAGEEPYDIFICYKETDEHGQRTLDSVLAQDIYEALTDKGYRVFFSRISLEDKLGVEYEPYIFAALNSAKIMLSVGTDYDHYNAVWVKNEWSRFLKLMAQDKQKHLIPCYKGIDAYDMPREFAKLQAQDLGKVGAMQDLLRGIEKLLPREEKAAPVPASAAPETSNLLRRAELFLEERNWSDAAAYCERILDADPECAEAYLMKAMATAKVSRRSGLARCASSLLKDNSWRNALRFAQPQLKDFLDATAQQIRTREEAQLREHQYTQAVRTAEKAKLPEEHEKAAEALRQLGNYKDAAELAQQSLKAAQAATNLRLLHKGQAMVAKAPADKTVLEEAEKLFRSLNDFPGAPEALQDVQARLTSIEAARRAQRMAQEAEWDQNWAYHTERAQTETDPNTLEQMAAFFDSTGGFRDSSEMAALCRERAQEQAQALRDRFAAEREKQALVHAQNTKHNKRLSISLLAIQIPLWIGAAASLTLLSDPGDGFVAAMIFLLVIMFVGVAMMPPTILGLLSLLRGRNGMRVASLVLSVLGGIFCGLITIVCIDMLAESAEGSNLAMTLFIAVCTAMHLNTLIHMILRKKL